MGTITKQTTHVKRWDGSQHIDIGNAVRRDGSSWADVAVMLRWSGAAWVYVYSRINVSLSGGGASSNSGASASGSDGSQAFATATGYVTILYVWTYRSGDSSIGINSTGAQNPVFSRNFTGVANGSSASTGTAVWRCTITDTTTGAEAYEERTIGPYQWTNTIPAFTPFSQPFDSGSGSVTVPAGCGHVTIHVVGGGPRGGAGYHSGSNENEVNIWGGGGSGAGYTVRTVAVSPGQSFGYSVAPAAELTTQAASSSVSGPGVSMTATGGYPGGYGGDGGAGATSVGTASGGDANYNGGTGGDGGAGGFGGASAYGGSYGYGGNGGSPFEGGGYGGGGRVVFEWGF